MENPQPILILNPQNSTGAVASMGCLCEPQSRDLILTALGRERMRPPSTGLN